MSELRTNPVSPDSTGYIAKRTELIDNARDARRFIDEHGLNHADGLEGITAEELLWLGLRLLKVNDVWQAYDMLAEKSSNGRAYYDLTLGLQHQRSYQIIEYALATHENQVDVGLDIATGTGEVASRLAKHCKRVLALDVVPSLLSVAGEKLGQQGANFSLVEGDVMDLDTLIPPNSVDVVTTNALDIYLLPQELRRFYKKLNRVLKPGGRAYEYYSDPDLTLVLMADSALSYPRIRLAHSVVTEVVRLSLKEANKNRSPILPEDYGFFLTNISIPNGTPFVEYVHRFEKI